MADQEKIREIFERNIRTLTAKPARGFITGTTKARLVDGLRCEIEEGPWRLAADLPAKIGGDETAPSPSVLGRGALASCLVLGIARWAARLGVPIEELEVEVQADFDARGELGMNDAISPGYSEIRYAISLRSPAPSQEVTRLLECAERYSPYLDNYGRAITLRRVEPGDTPPVEGLLARF